VRRRLSCAGRENAFRIGKGERRVRHDHRKKEKIIERHILDLSLRPENREGEKGKGGEVLQSSLLWPENEK